jgi:hypothetical protein
VPVLPGKDARHWDPVLFFLHDENGVAVEDHVAVRVDLLSGRLRVKAAVEDGDDLEEEEEEVRGKIVAKFIQGVPEIVR